MLHVLECQSVLSGTKRRTLSTELSAEPVSITGPQLEESRSGEVIARSHNMMRMFYACHSFTNFTVKLQ